MAKRERAENDFYPTPAWATRALLKKWRPPFTGGWLEPCFGDGSIIRATTEVMGEGKEMPEWTAVELRAECNDLLKLLIPQSVEFYCPQDFLTWEPPTKYNVVLTNPPFNQAMEFIQKSRSLSERVAMLLRLNFLGSQERAEFHRNNPADIYVLPKRPSFKWKGSDNCEYAWFVWGEQGGRWFMLEV